MTENHELDVTKKLSDNLETKINKLNAKWNKTKEEYKRDILDIYETAISERYTPTDAAKLCREKIEIFSDKTIMRALPDAATRSYKSNWTNVQSYASDMPKINNQTRLVVPEEPTIPPRPEVVREAEIVKPKKQVYTLNSKTCKGWPCERDYIYEIEVDEENKNVTKMYAISD